MNGHSSPFIIPPAAPARSDSSTSSTSSLDLPLMVASQSSDSNEGFSTTPSSLNQNDASGQNEAIEIWSRRVKICCVLHMFTAILLIRSTFYLSSFFGLTILLVFYAVAVIVRLRRKNFVYLYASVIALGFVRDGIILFFYLTELYQLGFWFDWLCRCMLIADAVIIVPITYYCLFYLHRATAISNVLM